jgi:hypothetical protein
VTERQLVGSIRPAGGRWRVTVDAHGGDRRRQIVRYAPTIEQAEELRARLVHELVPEGRRYRPERRPPRPVGLTPGRRFPLQPLLVGGMTIAGLARAAGVPRARAQGWARRGCDEWTADLVATAVGRHPAEVWPDWLPHLVA